ncbi:MAG: hypothetical protein OEV28_14190, partial [Nitrospirota bacterium]|nr:hypothetical protein [Nitrospirota bacterium]
YQAYLMFMKADGYYRDVPFKDQLLVQKPTKVINQFVDALNASVTKEDEKGNFGLAYQLLKIIAEVEPHFPGIKNRLAVATDKLAQRAIKGLAVIPFKSPSYSPEAGKIFSSNIMFYLHKNLRPDIKVVEREAIETIIKESELKHAGDDSGGNGALNISGVDYFLLGDVLDYKIETSNRDVQKSVRAQTRTERVRNPDYDSWLVTKERLGDKAPAAPPMSVDKPVIEEIRYKITYYKKVAMADISYKVVDIKGKIINANVIKFKEEASDEGTDGIDAGDFKVPVRFADVPSDIELMGRVQVQAIDKIGEELKAMLGNPEKRYFNEAARLEKDGNIRESIERYSDAEIIYSKKGLDANEITLKYGKLLDSITGI